MRRVGLFAVAVAIVASPSAATAAPEDVATSISQQIMSPFCPGVTLHDCPSAQADELRGQIAEWAGAGWSRDRIMDRLVAEYGEDVRALPSAEGRGLFAWLLPVLAVGTGGTLAWVLVRRWTNRGGPTAVGAVTPNPSPMSPTDRGRLNKELDALRSRT
jgi:cytochrome c-type biogenesis protein CcmH/NrfF